MWDANYQPPVVRVCGQVFEEEDGLDFAEVVKGHARDAGFSKFRVFVTSNGVESEVEDNDAPLTLEEGMEVTLKPYEKAA